MGNDSFSARIPLPGRSRFSELSSSDMQPTTDDSADADRVEKDLSKHLAVYEASGSIIIEGVGSDRLPAPSDKFPKSEIISKEHPPFEAETLIVHPMMDEELNDERFYKGRDGPLLPRIYSSSTSINTHIFPRTRRTPYSVSAYISRMGSCTTSS